MDVFKNVLPLWMVIFLGFVSRSGETVHSDNHHDYGFERILKTMKLNNSLELQNLTTLLTSLGIHDCTNKTGRLHKCVTAASLFEVLNLTTTSRLKETDFAKIATLIVYFLLPWMEDHSDSNLHKNSKQTLAVYENLLKRYATSGLCEQILDQLLRDVNGSIGKQLNNLKCFSSHEILHEMNISNDAVITNEQFPRLSTIIISMLLEKRCIKVHHKTPLPCPSHFVNELFNKFSVNNVINKKEMKELLKHLMIGKHELINENRDSHNDNRHRRHISKMMSSRPVTNMEIPFEPYMQEMKYGHTRRSRRGTQSLRDNRVKNIYNKCYSVDQLFSIYHVDEKNGFNVERFQHLSSALLHELESNVCLTEVQNPDKPFRAAWGYSLAAVSIVSLFSIIMIIPAMQVKFYQQMLIFFISLAIGTLVGDALLHLLPYAIGFHGQDNHGHSGLIYADKDKSYLWRFLAAVAGIYGLFLFETTVQLFFRNTYASRESHSVKNTSAKQEGGQISSAGDVEAGRSEPNKQAFVLANKITQGENEVQIEEGMSSNDYEIEEKTNNKTNIAPMAWTIIFGDTIHNITDGIAIGVAFSESIFGGISTSIAVLCHEVPHELGDFVVLLESGMSLWQALLANLASSCFCFLGLVFGKLISDIEDVNLWILAITAGIFLYIALTSKLPELMRISAASKLSKLSIILLQNTGIIVGFLGMTLLAFYKKDINV